MFITTLAAPTIDAAFAANVDLTGLCVCTNATSVEHGREE